jgi:hypothetical protein
VDLTKADWFVTGALVGVALVLADLIAGSWLAQWVLP